MNRTAIKSMAKAQIKGKIGILFVIALIATVLSSVASAILSIIPYAGAVASSILVSAPLALGSIMVYLDVVNSREIKIETLFKGYGDIWNAFVVQFMTGLFTFLWSLLFIVPGIIKSISYSMAMYILAENKGMNPMEAIKKSKEMMNGHKMEYFVLMLSFIGWSLLGIITCGIGFIWIAPYMSATFANFYNIIKGTPEIIETETYIPEEADNAENI